MIDLTLTTNGDIILLENPIDNMNRLKCTFTSGKSTYLKCSFSVFDIVSTTLNSEYLKIKIDVLNKKKANRALTSTDEECIKQMITTELKTYLGDILNKKDYGTTLQIYTHKNIYDDKVIANIKKEVDRVAKKYFRKSIDINIYPMIKDGSIFYSGLIIEMITEIDNYIINLEV